MRIPPKKPHFFKPILPGFMDGLKIPTSFSKYLCEERPVYTVLKRGDKKWKVKISGQSLQEGWRRFAMENKLEVGDFVVFKHEGNMVFEVMVFDPSHCEREYRTLDDFRNIDPKQKEMSPKKFKSSGLRRNPAKNAISIGSEGTAKEENVLTPKSRKVSSHDDDEESDNSYFVSWVKPYCIKFSILHIPMRFATANNLYNRRRNLIIRDPQQRSWQVELVPNSGHICIRRGWNEFFSANGLKLGDSFKFELVENGETPILNFVPQPQLLSNSNTKQRNKKLEDSSDQNSNSHPYFVSTIKPYSIKNTRLHLPMKFARSTGLVELNGEMILRDERKRPWLVKLEHNGTHVDISRGWSTFRTSNGLNVGDTYKFELIKKGDRPVANFYCKYSEEGTTTTMN
ncbi:hypothetical protein ACH5RR_039556 [Cinchona calisaya]|uniref:TF-B3 domain-containing protein n=1 Tax=Cinchona calisaya TaxID=153742 RepID=A0ABD2Y477_9GENT